MAGLSECMQFVFVIIQNLKKNLLKKNLSTNVGDEIGFAPNLNSDEEAIEVNFSHNTMGLRLVSI